MSRWKLLRSDTPLRVRDLPPLPRRLPKSYDLEHGWFHLLLSALDQTESLPRLLLLCTIAFYDLVALRWTGVAATFVLGLTQLVDWLTLMQLPRLRISFGPQRIEWLSLSALRLVGALALSAILPRTWRRVRGGLLMAIQLAASLLVIRAFILEPRAIRLRHLQLVRNDEPPKGVTVLHVADVHVERLGRREEQVLRITRALKPDLILFSGDLVNLSYVRDETARQHARALWRALSVVAPVFAVSGSPPVDSAAVSAAVLGGLPVCLLRDDTRCIELRGIRVQVVGVNCTHDPGSDGQRLRALMARCEPADITILLYHWPDLAPQAAALGSIDLQLSGHTHGGQICAPWFGALLTGSLYGKQLERGLYRLREMLLYVSPGIGFEGLAAPRARLLCRPEMTVIHL